MNTQLKQSSSVTEIDGSISQKLREHTLPRYITVEGPIGVGKTTLARRLADTLRYPLLLEPEVRDIAYDLLKSRGLGASRMYPVSLPRIPGLEPLFKTNISYPSAERFAARILTLPLHEWVTDADITGMSACLSRPGR